MVRGSRDGESQKAYMPSLIDMQLTKCLLRVATTLTTIACLPGETQVIAKGRVLDSCGEPASGVQVVLGVVDSGRTIPLDTLVTDSSGAFFFSDMISSATPVLSIGVTAPGGAIVEAKNAERSHGEYHFLLRLPPTASCGKADERYLKRYGTTEDSRP